MLPLQDDFLLQQKAPSRALRHPQTRLRCSGLARNLKTLDIEETKLRTHPGNIDTPTNVFETAIGRFWGFTGTRDYMRARYAVVDALGGINTREAVAAQLDHVLDMFRLCYDDNLGMRTWLCPLMIRLDMDQECYNFIEWYAEWGNKAQPGGWKSIDIRNPRGKNLDLFHADPLCLAREFFDLSVLAAITLLQVRALPDLYSLHRNRGDLRRLGLPKHVLDACRPCAPRSAFVARNSELMSRSNHLDKIVFLETKVYQFYVVVQKLNRHFWRLLLNNPGNSLMEQPESFVFGSVKEAKIVLACSYSAWVETPGALGLVRVKSSNGDWKLPPGFPR